MAQTSNNEGSWEENMYWNLFRNTRFAIFLPSDFKAKLALPEKFGKKMKENLPQTVTLKGPSGDTWTVKIASQPPSTVIFGSGWKEFCEDHSLQENDMLMFKYNGQSCFSVLIIDSSSNCEKETTYFVRKSGTKSEDNGQTRRRDRDPHFEEHYTANGAGNASHGEPLNDCLKTPSRPQEVPRPSDRRKKKKGPVEEDDGPSFEKEFAPAGENETKCDAEEPPFDATGQQNALNRRPVGEDDKETNLQQAKAKLASTKNGFMVVMRSTYVSKKFHMAIPSGWSRQHLPPKNLDVILEVSGATETWSSRFLFSKGRNYGVLGGGWKAFVLQNKLEEFDVCVFKPVNEEQLDLVNKGEHDTINMEVTIFQVARDVAPLAQVASSSSRATEE